MSKSDMVASSSLMLPNELNYSIPKSFKSSITRRDMVSRNCTGTSTGINPGQTIIFEIPAASGKCIDLAETYFSVTATATTSVPRLKDIRDCISRVRILTDSGQELEVLQAANALNRLVLYSHYPDDYLNHVETAAGRPPERMLVRSQVDYSDVLQYDAAAFADVFATDNDANAVVRRDNEAAAYEGDAAFNSGVYHVFRVECSGFLNAKQFWPLVLGGLRIEMELEQAAIALQGASGSYTWNTPEIHYSQISLSDQAAASLAQAVKSGKMAFSYATWSHQQSTVNTTSHTVTISKPYNRVKNLFCVRRLMSDQVAANDSFNFTAADFLNYQWKYGDMYIPIKVVDQLKRAYYEFRKAVGTFGSYSDSATPWLDYRASTGGRFIIAANMESLLSDPYSGVSLSNGQFAELLLNSSAGTTSRLDIYTYYQQVAAVNPDGSITIRV